MEQPSLSAVSEAVQVPLHQTQLPVVVLQASGVGSKAQGSEGRVRVRRRPRVTPLNPPERNSRPPQPTMARDTERLTGSPTAESGCIQVLQLIWYRDTVLL